jgi:hypothetical protein
MIVWVRRTHSGDEDVDGDAGEDAAVGSARADDCVDASEVLYIVELENQIILRVEVCDCFG